MKNTIAKSLCGVAAAGLLSACASTEMPQFPGMASNPQEAALDGSASGSTTVDSKIPRCSGSLGSLIVNEDDSGWSRYRGATQIASLEPLIRQMVMQSGCFNVVADIDSDKMQKLEAIKNDANTSGDARPDQGFEAGQRMSADFVLFPEVNFAEQTCGNSNMMNAGLNVIGGMIGVKSSQKIETKCATVTFSLFDVRTSEQKATSTGQGSVNNVSISFSRNSIFSRGASQQALKSPEGKATLLALVDAYSDMVPSMENYEPLEYGGAKLN